MVPLIAEGEVATNKWKVCTIQQTDWGVCEQSRSSRFAIGYTCVWQFRKKNQVTNNLNAVDTSKHGRGYWISDTSSRSNVDDGFAPIMAGGTSGQGGGLPSCVLVVQVRFILQQSCMKDTTPYCQMQDFSGKVLLSWLPPRVKSYRLVKGPISAPEAPFKLFLY